MTMHKLFLVKDKAANTFDGPILKHTNRAAVIRDFTRTVNDDKTQLGQYPNDYDLYYVGEQDDETGEIKAEYPELVITGQSARATGGN